MQVKTARQNQKLKQNSAFQCIQWNAKCVFTCRDAMEAKIDSIF